MKAPMERQTAGQPYRLVWFQHFHKAAGTSVIELARRNGEGLYPRHANGNPLGDDDRPLPLWQLDPAGLTAFVDDCQGQGVSFVATEWGVPHLETLAADPRVVLVTCLRRPLQRLVSNYYYDVYGGYTAARRLGWTVQRAHENRSDGGALQLLKDLGRGRLARVRDRRLHPRRPPDAAFRAAFARASQWDLRLYALVAEGGPDR